MKSIKDVKVSLIVAVYKSATFLPKLMDSIMNQTHSNIEIILVDDGSPDESGKLCDQYASKDKRVIVIHKENGGVCEARNAGMSIMTGEYFSVIDGDDWLSTDYVEYLLNLAITHNADMALADTCFTTRDLKQVEYDNIEIWTPEQLMLLVIMPSMPIGPWSKLYKTDFMKRHQLSFDCPMSGETPYLLTRIAGKIKFVVKGHKRIYYYRQNNSNSALTSNAVIYALNALYNIKRTKKVNTLKSPRVIHAIDWHIWKNYNFLLRLIIATNSKKKYWKEYLTCLFMIRWLLPKAVLGTEFSRQEKIQFVKRAINPVKYAKALTAQQMEALKNDKFK